MESCNPDAGQYPTKDSECVDLESYPNQGCYGPPCNKTCYPTEDKMNNFRAIRRMDSSGTLYAEYAIGNQTNKTIEFDRVDFHELFEAQVDPWMIQNLYNSTSDTLLSSLHNAVDTWYKCKGKSCP